MAPDEIEESKYGEPIRYNKDFSGPLTKRSCTDILCLIIFVAFLGAWGFIGFYAIRNGDVNRLVVPTDSQGLKCGVDSEVINQKYLFFFNLERCIDINVPINGCPTPQVCVSECPKETFTFTVQKCQQESIQTYVNKLICSRDVNKQAIQSCNDIERLIDSDQCARWYMRSDPYVRRCISALPKDSCPFVPKSRRARSDITTPDYYANYYHEIVPRNFDNENNSSSSPAIALSQQRSEVQEMPAIKCDENRLLSEAILKDKASKFAYIEEAQKIVEDIVVSWIPILIGLIIAMICSLIVIAMMRWLAAPLLWLSIIGVIGILGFAIYYSAMKYVELKNVDPNERPNANTNLSAIMENYLRQQTTWLVILIITSIVLFIILLVILVLRKRIVIAIALVKEGSKAVSTIYSTVFFPIIPWIVQILVIGFAIIVGLYLASVGNQIHTVVGLSTDTNCQCTGIAAAYKDGDLCDPRTFHDNCHTTENSLISRLLRQSHENSCTKAACHFRALESPAVVGYFHAVNIVGFFWGIFFISAFSQMVLAATFATWYWTFHKSNVPFFTLTQGLGRTLRYHLGTLAFGSLIITICRLIRVMLEYIDQKCKKFDNIITKGILCCCKCFFWCLENFLTFLNKNAYIMCAVHGKGFCSSAKDAFNLLMRNFLRVYALDKVTDFLFFLSKLLLMLGVGAMTYFYLMSPTNELELNYPIVPVIIVMIGTYLIGTVFFSVYSMAVDTLFLCFLEDCERNDGSPEKPYYMSKNLMSILGKRNELDRSHYE